MRTFFIACLAMSASGQQRVGLSNLRGARKPRSNETSLDWPNLIQSPRELEKAIKNGTNVNAKYNGRFDGDNEYNTPLYMAASNGNIEAVKILLEAGADVNAKNFKGETPLYVAISKNNNELAKLLMQYNADVNHKVHGWTPLYFAILKKNNEIAKILIEHNANVDLIDYYGYSPLMLAARNGDVEAVQLLIDNGADITRQSTPQPYPKTALAIAQDVLAVKNNMYWEQEQSFASKEDYELVIQLLEQAEINNDMNCI